MLYFIFHQLHFNSTKQKKKKKRGGGKLDWLELKGLADDEIKVKQKLFFYLEKIENIVVKGETAGYLHFSFSHDVFIRFYAQGR